MKTLPTPLPLFPSLPWDKKKKEEGGENKGIETGRSVYFSIPPLCGKKEGRKERKIR